MSKIYQVIGKSGLETQLEGIYFRAFYSNYDGAFRMFQTVKKDVKDLFLDEECDDGGMITRNSIYSVSLDIINVIDGE